MKKWYVVYESNRDKLWQVTQICGRWPFGWSEQKTIKGTLPPMNNLQLCDLFGIKYEYKQHQYKECVEQDINKKLKTISFYGADAKAARINLRIATEFSCPACGRPVAKRQSQPLYYCLYCDMTYDKKQLKKGVAND